MITYNNIIGRFEKFVEDHFLLKTFTHGSPSGVDLEKFEVYPALHVVYTGSTYDNTSKEYSFEVYILDLPPDKAKKIENQTQLVSNAEQVAEDILADMRNGGHIFDFGHLYTVGNASTTPLEETTSNSLAGILLTISIEVGFTFDSCNAPLDGVNPEGSAFPSASPSGLRIKEVDGSPDVVGVTTIIVSDGTLTDDGLGVVTIDTSDKGAGVYLPLIGGTLTGDLIVDTKIGIGTSSPTEKLEVVGDVLVSGDTMSDAYKPNAAGEPIKLKNFGGDEVVTVLDSGNLGIGTINPTFKVDIYDNTTTTNPLLKLRQDSSGDAALGFNIIGSTQLSIGLDNSDGDKFKISRSSNLGTSNQLTISSAGGVGLNTSNPTEVLDVNGNIKASGTLSVSGELDMNSNKITEVLAGTTNLDAVNYQQLTDAILGVLTYKGIWDADINDPSLASGVGVVGGYYIVSVSGNTNLDGLTDWAVGDWAVFSDLPVDAWQKIDNTSILGGAGTGGKISVWTGSGVSRTLGDSVITESGGNIGIGATSPTSDLQIGDGTTDPNLRVYYIDGSYTQILGYGIDMSRTYSYIRPTTDNVGTLYIGAAANTWKELLFHATTTIFNTEANGESMRITSTGNVGIGSVSPTAKLEVDGNVKIGDGTTGATFTKSGNDFLIQGVDVDGNAWNSIHLKADSLTGLYIEKDTNNVGIGTDSPGGALDVVGTYLSTLFRVSNTDADATTKYGSFMGRHYTNSEENITGMLLTSSSNALSGGTVSIGGGITSANAVNLIKFYTATTNTTLQGTERMRIDNSGNVGIGTVSPVSKLDISGGDVEVQDIASGIIMKSPDGTRYRVTVANGGTLSVAAV